ncbi:MAG: hypothetical protein ABJB74_10875 [Gemmatimonas sp.]
MIERQRNLAPALFAAFAFAVLSSSAPAQTPRVRDSVGIRIVENSSRTKASIAFTLGATPNVDIGGLEDDPDKEFLRNSSIPQLTRLSDGRVAVADKNRIQFFDNLGKRLRIAGRSGGGPGEFQGIAGLCRIHGDTVLASDFQNRRFSVLDQKGEYRSLTTFPVGNFSDSQFCLNDGTIMALQYLPRNAQGESGFRINHLNRAGAIMNEIAVIKNPPADPVVNPKSSFVTGSENVYYGNGAEQEFRVFSAQGKLVSIVRTADKLEPITRNDLEDMSSGAGRAGSKTAGSSAGGGSPAPVSHAKTLPTYDRILIDMSERVWMQDFEPDIKTQAEGWTAFDRTGKLLGRIVIPVGATKEKRQTVVHFGKDEVFVKRPDDDGATHYTAYPILSKK